MGKQADQKKPSRYFICDACAEAKGWKPPTWAVTVMKGTCGYCGAEDVMLTPVTDFKKPDGREPVWD